MIFFILSIFVFFQGENYVAKKISEKPVIDGRASELFWREARWYPVDQLWIGDPYSVEDFEGQFKVAWDEEYLYLLVEITDDKLIDIHENGLVKYWDDDCVEIFVDEDNSDGEHQYNYNAFAYHVSLTGDVVDFGKEGPLYFNDHVKTARTHLGRNTYVWEHRISVYDDSFEYRKDNDPVDLFAGKEIGFAVAYCDNDDSAERENFIGSVFVAGDDKNKGYIDAGIFGTLKLIE